MFENLFFFVGLWPMMWIALSTLFFVFGLAFARASSQRYAGILEEAREERVVLLSERNEANRKLRQISAEARAVADGAPGGAANPWMGFGK